MYCCCYFYYAYVEDCSFCSSLVGDGLNLISDFLMTSFSPGEIFLIGDTLFE